MGLLGLQKEFYILKGGGCSVAVRPYNCEADGRGQKEQPKCSTFTAAYYSSASVSSRRPRSI